MAKRSPESRLLWKALIILLVAILLGVAATAGGILYRDTVSQQLQEMQQQLKATENKELQHKQQLALIHSYQPIYQSFEAKGVINQEPRLKWLEIIDQISQEFKFTAPVRYKLEVRKPFDAPFILPPNGLTLYASIMTLNMSLLHEGDLFNFFAALDQRAHGVFNVPSCSIKRTSTRYVLNGRTEWTTSLEGECVLNWFTLWGKEEAR
ncbi:MAG: hypothetical protein HQL74_03280 [Magnetococcales bacterium]|nr:hypothetical protein [Magnetococcales bacterium]